jgi:hypothetical protein
MILRRWTRLMTMMTTAGLIQILEILVVMGSRGGPQAHYVLGHAFYVFVAIPMRMVTPTISASASRRGLVNFFFGAGRDGFKNLGCWPPSGQKPGSSHVVEGLLP